ncbi:L-asparaginase precursor [Mytilinidion resinicola]|uniref:L-asparaginase n=1 Tax=Mytilinidion resinicola TaxID=574789 RepID=A0A6A6YA24_9PEZI|nr:L-asparaginase precursor [Mytilinidion resinicola]KAF2804677.1 L-asparaginase precursor [Mytilinidion resinicola]
MSSTRLLSIQPRIIIHGGAGNISRDNLTSAAYEAYRKSLLSTLSSASESLQKPGATALDVATFAVSLLENDPLFNSGKGAVFTRAGTNELESSIMVSDGKRKRGVGCMLLKHVKNPIKLAREFLVQGDTGGGGGAQGHCQLSGEYLEGLAEEWGLDIVTPDYFFTQKRWDEHRRGLEAERELGSAIAQFQDPFPLSNNGSEAPTAGLGATGDPSWDGKEYLPQGTVGAVVLDSFGTLCVATSTGGLTNKLPGRIGDTPTLGAGYWAEEWFEEVSKSQMLYQSLPTPSSSTSSFDKLSRGDTPALISDCLPSTALRQPQVQASTSDNKSTEQQHSSQRHAVAMSGTGNGDSFLRVNAVRTAAAISRFSSPNTALSKAVSQVAGSGGELQKSAGDRWGKTGEGEGGIIGIELVGTHGSIVADFNCGGMFRAWVDDAGEQQCMVFKDEY